MRMLIITLFALVTLPGCELQTMAKPPSLASEPTPAIERAGLNASPFGVNVAADKPIIARAGGITYEAWGNANDPIDFNTVTHSPDGGRWGHNTNGGTGTYEIVDLGAVYQLTGIGYALDWDGAFQNPLTVQVDASLDNEVWTKVSYVTHGYRFPHQSNHVDIDYAISPIAARYVRFSEPPDGAWNGWGTFFQLRVYTAGEP